MEILIAEDDPVSRNLLRVMLEKLSHKVLIAEDGLKALEVLKENEDIKIHLAKNYFIDFS